MMWLVLGIVFCGIAVIGYASYLYNEVDKNED